MHYVLKISCRDEIGLVAKVASMLAENNISIASTHEFVDSQHKMFYMRTEFTTDLDNLQDKIKHKLPENSVVKLNQVRKRKLVILGTKEYHCVAELILQAMHGDINAEIQAVICNHANLEKLVSNLGVPFLHISHVDLTRTQHEKKLLDTIRQYEADYIVLAKYMRILSPQFVAEFSNKIINIHHSFLPAFIGANPYKQAFERGVKIIGATSHFVNDKLDDGPIIAQNVISVDHSHSAEEMAKFGHDIEKTTLTRALKLVLEDRVFVSGNKTIIFD